MKQRVSVSKCHVLAALGKIEKSGKKFFLILSLRVGTADFAEKDDL